MMSSFEMFLTLFLNKKLAHAFCHTTLSLATIPQSIPEYNQKVVDIHTDLFIP